MAVHRARELQSPTRRHALAALGGAVATVAGLRQASAQAPAVVTRNPVQLKFSFLVGPDSAFGRAFTEFARLTAERTNNTVTIQLFPNGQLGGDLEVIEQIRLGAPMLTLGYDAALEQHIPDFGAFSAPYLFPNWAAAQRFFASDLYRGIAEQTFPRAGVIFECRNWRTGWRHWINKVRPFNVPEDMRGVKLRAQQAPTYLAYMRACGAVPVPIAVPELYAAVQQGVVDGASSIVAGLRAWRLYETCRHFSLTHHVLVGGGLFAGKFFVDLPADLKQIMIQSYTEAAELQNRLQDGAEAEDRRFMESQGVTFNNVEPAPWVRAVEPVFEQFKSRWSAGLVDRIRAIIAQA